MAYDAGLAERMRELLVGRRGVIEKAMFGGVAFLLDGKMFVGIAKSELMVRVGPEAYEDALRDPHARTMDFTGRPMRGYVFVAPAGFEEDEALARWIDRSAAHVATLPAKEAKRPAAKRPLPVAAKPASPGKKRKSTR